MPSVVVPTLRQLQLGRVLLPQGLQQRRFLLKMPVTRSASAAAKRSENEDFILPAVTRAVPETKKRKNPAGESVTAKRGAKGKKARSAEESRDASPAAKAEVPNATAAAAAAPARRITPVAIEGQSLVPAELTFSFEEARQHLIGIDKRFEDVFRRLQCRPFEHLERVDPFRYGDQSIHDPIYCS